MADITTRETSGGGATVKGSPLTNAEVDTNFINLQTDKIELTDISVAAEPDPSGDGSLAYNSTTGVFTYTPPADIGGAVTFAAQAGEALSKGDAVYVSGVSGNKPVVSKADADDANKMPAYGLAEDAANLNAAVNVVTFGTLYDLNTSGFGVGDDVYVSTTAGALASSAPTGESSLIQNIAMVVRSHASAGSIKVGGAGRINATPNLNDGNVFIGNASNQAVARALTGDDISGGTITSFASTGIDDNATGTRITVNNSFTEFDATNHYVKLNGSTDSTHIGTSSSNNGYSYFLNNSPSAGTGNSGFALYDSGAVEIWASADNVITGSLRIDASGDTTVKGFTSTGGTIKLDGSHPVGTRNTALGQTAFNSAQSGAGYNVAVGFQSMYNNTTGTHNVGIGYNALVLNTTGHSNSALGFSPLSANTTGLYNVAVGYEAMRDNTTANNNVAVGYQSSHRNTTGAQNVAVGRQALYFNTTGTYNSALGDAALFSNTTASNNTAVGREALLSNTTGTENTAVGALSMDASTTASYSTALGARAAGALTTGSYNTALGRGAFSTATTATNSVAVGNDALYSNTIGDFNHALGVVALYDNTTGEHNVAVGYAALYNNTTASGNTAVGHNACFANQTSIQLTGIGYGALQNTTSSANTAVGYAAGYGNTSGYYNVAIGDYALYDTQTSTNHVAVGHYALFENTSGDSNTALGSTALQNTNTGSYNVGVGRQAGQANTSGALNTFVGFQTALSNTSGGANTAVGASAFGANTTASYCVAVGYQTLDANTTGARNCAVGYGAMTTNTTGNYNTAYGSYALNSQTTPNFNVAVGYQSGYTTTTGFDNTYLGTYAGYSGTAAARNVYIGYTAGYYGTGSNNVALGYQAGNGITSGNNLTVIGYDADPSSGTATNEVTLGNSSVATLRCQVALTVLSDERDKKNIESLGNASDFIKALRPVSFDWNQRDGERMGQSDHGFIAQELKTAQKETNWHVPRLVYESNPDKLEASYATLLPSVVSALQEALTEIESLKAQVAQLSGE